MRRTMKFLIILITVIFSSQINGKEKFYKWTDADGNTHYTKTKPTNTESDEIKVNNNSPTTVKEQSLKGEEDDSNESTEEEKTPEQKAIDDFNANEKKRVQAKQDKANCKIARKNLKTLQQTVRVTRKNPATGEMIRMDDKERMAMLKKSKDSIKKLCQ